jgi:predicted kinase
MATLWPHAAALAACGQDPVFHAEGDVWTHTARVRGALDATPRARALYGAFPATTQAALRLAAWYHDVAKPATRVEEWDPAQGRLRVSNPGHAARGAAVAWRDLIDAGAPAHLARQVWALIAWHHKAHHLLDTDGPTQILRFLADGNGVGWAALLALAQADLDGRDAADADTLLERLDLCRLAVDEVAADVGCNALAGQSPFANAEARLRFCRAPQLGMERTAFPLPAKGTVVLASGLPGSGKTTAIQRLYPGWAVVSLDALRATLDTDPTAAQGPVLAAAFEAARVHLRAGTPFVWDATALGKRTRAKIVGLARDYGAPVHALSLDVPQSVARARNAARANPIPDAMVAKLAGLREPIGPDEAHHLWSVDAEGHTTQVW